MPETPDGRDLTVAEFAHRTHRHQQSVYRACRRGEIPSYKIGKSVRIRREDADNLRTPRTPDDTPASDPHLQHLLDTAPPLSQEQRVKLAELLAPVRRSGGDSGG